MKTCLALLLIALTAPFAPAPAADWQTAWNEMVAAARKEGKVVVTGSPDPVMREQLIPAFTARFGIAVDFMAGKSGEIADRGRLERSAGMYSFDVYLAGPDTAFTVLYPQKMLDPLRPQLILPEVTDGSRWKIGKLWFMDPQESYILRLFSTVGGWFFINTDYVKPEQVDEVHKLLDPKWKGKISSEDPADVTGAGGARSTWFYQQLGPAFVKQLYISQKTVITRDRRQMTDWLARGVYPICMSCRSDDVDRLTAEGFRMFRVYDLKGIESKVNGSPFLVSLANQAPHPNAAKVFLNWLLGKEAMELYSRSAQVVSLRNDVDESFLDPRVIPKPGVAYADDTDPKWRADAKLDIAKKVVDLLRAP
jgi:iron(III) transport system substrate-binding protein